MQNSSWHLGSLGMGRDMLQLSNVPVRYTVLAVEWCHRNVTGWWVVILRGSVKKGGVRVSGDRDVCSGESAVVT